MKNKRLFSGKFFKYHYVGHMYGLTLKKFRIHIIRLDEDLARLFKALG